MRNKILVAAATAFVLSSVALAPCVVSAQPSPAQMRKAGEVKDRAGADAAVAKVEAKAAKSKAHKAHKKAKRAAHKAKVAAKDAARS